MGEKQKGTHQFVFEIYHLNLIYWAFAALQPESHFKSLQSLATCSGQEPVFLQRSLSYLKDFVLLVLCEVKQNDRCEIDRLTSFHPVLWPRRSSEGHLQTDKISGGVVRRVITLP